MESYNVVWSGSGRWYLKSESATWPISLNVTLVT